MNNQEFEKYYQQKRKEYRNFYKPIVLGFLLFILYYYIMRKIFSDERMSALFIFPVTVLCVSLLVKIWKRKRMLDREMIDLKRERKNRR